MDLIELLRECFSNLALNKLRTGLAILGIVIGIGSVIALVSIGQGSQKQVETQIQSLGANLLTVIPGGQNSGAVRGASGGGTSLTLEDALGILSSSQITTVKSVSPESSRRLQAVAGKNNTNTQVIGVYPLYAEIRKINLASGSFISQRDVDSLTKVAVLGATAASDLFGDSDPVGQNLRLNGQTFKIIGVAESKGGTGFNNADDAIYVPLSTAQKQLFGTNYLSTIAVEAKSKELMTQAQNEVGYYLLSRHHLSDPTNADFSIFSQNDILSAASQVTGTFTTLLSGIAAISLLVGGIGIMNIMFVTVTERTREIGLRKSLGAKKKLIITQFLFEAAILTFIGGVIGLIFGVSVSFILSKTLSFPFAVSFPSVFLAVGVSGIIGLVFGWYPAKKASDLPPIVALRYE